MSDRPEAPARYPAPARRPAASPGGVPAPGLDGLQLLDLLGTGVFLVDGGAGILYANQAGALLLRDDPLRAAPLPSTAEPRQRLAAATPMLTARLHAMIATAARGGSTGALRLVAEQGPRMLRLLATPVSPAAQPPSERRILVLASTLHAPSPLPDATLVALYALSPSETSVAHALLDGATAEQVAQDRCVSTATIRTQIRSILHKTGARNLRELERFIAAT